MVNLPWRTVVTTVRRQVVHSAVGAVPQPPPPPAYADAAASLTLPARRTRDAHDDSPAAFCLYQQQQPVASMQVTALSSVLAYFQIFAELSHPCI